MAGALNMGKVSEALKLHYLPGLTYQMNESNPLVAIMEKDSKSVAGSEIRMALRYGRHGGIGNRTDDGDLPTPNSRQTKQARWETKNMFAQIQISDKTMRASRGGGGFAPLLEADLEDAMTDSTDDLERQMFGNNQGAMATAVVNATGSKVIGVDSSRFFFEGQIIDIVTAATGVIIAAAREILAVDDVANTITINGADVVVTAGAIIVRSGNFGLELTGLKQMFERDTTIYGINRAQNKWFNPTVFNSVGTISEVGIQKAFDEVDRKAGGKPNILLSSHGVRRAYQELLLATKRTVDTMTLKGGYDALLYNGNPFAVSKYAPTGTLYGLDMNTIKMYQLMDYDWLDEDGAILSRVPNKAVWSATLAKYCDTGMSKPAGSFAMHGITER